MGKHNVAYCMMLRADTEEIEIQVIKSRRRTLGLEVDRKGTMKARIPFAVSKKAAEEFVREHKNWILKKRAQLRQQEQRKRKEAADIPAWSELPREQAAKIRSEFLRKAEYFAGQMGVRYGRITIRSQKTRWGSCSSRGNLNFNYQLYFLPEELMDYVVIHELAHRKHMNHSADFWKEVERFCPAYREKRRLLQQIGIAER